MKLSRFGSTIAVALLAAAAWPAAAQPPVAHVNKLGYVNTERVLHDSRKAQEVRKSLEAEFQKRDLEISAGPQADLERRRGALGDEMNQRRDEELQQFIVRINGIVRRIAVAEKVDIVFLDAIYFNTRIDMTDKVIKELDAGR